ncbi:uncharacterized protein A4U43_C02F6500 [Asparagus officinalis]|uniref:Thioesterase domain-containing protein n=1 Tax=Asparagus officinalis TaxID=4686 RepID=A0A5P1FGD0_ASPOF|nr:uncharacterized protein A4U43_C02F6500 [Asparagus officinalis]
MDLESVKKSLEDKSTSFDPLHRNLYNSFILNALRVDLVEPHRVLCSLTVIPRLRNDGNYLHGGVIATLVDLVGSAVFFAAGHSTSGVSLELNVSHFDAAFVGVSIKTHRVMCS